MADSIQVAAFEGGELRLLAPSEAAGEVVLALPLGRLIAKMVRVPNESREDPTAFATPLLQAMSPYPDEPLTVSVETVSDSEHGLVVLAAAMPESASDDIADALDAKGLSVTRVDALFLGQMRGLWGQLGTAAGVRKLLAVQGAEGLSMAVLDGDVPSAVRAVSTDADLRCEVMRLLLEAEDFGGAKPLAEVIFVGGESAGGLEAFAPVRRLEVGEDAGLVGVAARAAEPGTLNALPESWRTVLEETRFKAKLVRRLSVAAGLWLLVMAVIFGVPMVFDYLAGRQKDLCKAHARVYQSVKDTKDKVELVRKYSDHSRGALEVMKAVSDRLPEGIELESWNYRRDEGVKVSGLADEASRVYEFKDNMSAVFAESVGAEDGEQSSERVFEVVELNGPSAGKGGRQKFDLDCRYRAEEEE